MNPYLNLVLLIQIDPNIIKIDYIRIDSSEHATSHLVLLHPDLNNQKFLPIILIIQACIVQVELALGHAPQTIGAGSIITPLFARLCVVTQCHEKILSCFQHETILLNFSLDITVPNVIGAHIPSCSEYLSLHFALPRNLLFCLPR